MKFETAIKATQREIERLKKSNQKIQNNIVERCDYFSLRNKYLELIERKCQLQAPVELHEEGIKRLTPKKLAVTKTELAEIKKEQARLEKISRLDIQKESEKQADIEMKIDDLRIELLQLNNMARH